MANLNNSFIYKKFKTTLIQNFGKEKAFQIWNEANAELNSLQKIYKNIGSDEKMMVLPLFALYQTMKNHNIENALELLKEYAHQTGSDISKMIHKVTSIPGLSKLLWKNISKLMRNSSSPKKGYQRKIVSETSELVGVDILRCPLLEMCKKLNAPEIACVICIIDKEQMSGFKYIQYTRTKALGNGDDFCDYRLRFDKNKI